MYCSGFCDIKVGSQRSTVLVMCLVLQKDIDKYGLNNCLKEQIKDLRDLVEQGIFDKKTNTTLQVRVIASLGKDYYSYG